VDVKILYSGIGGQYYKVDDVVVVRRPPFLSGVVDWRPYRRPQPFPPRSIYLACIRRGFVGLEAISVPLTVFPPLSNIWRGCLEALLVPPAAYCRALSVQCCHLFR